MSLNTAPIERYDQSALRQLAMALDVLGKPLFKIYENLTPESAEIVTGILDMVVENMASGDFNAAHAYKRSIRCLEELELVFRDAAFQTNFAKVAQSHGFEIRPEAPSFDAEGALIRYFPFEHIKHYTPDFERDKLEVEQKLNQIRDYLQSLVSEKTHLKVDQCVPLWGEAHGGSYTRGLEGFHVRLRFPG